MGHKYSLKNTPVGTGYSNNGGYVYKIIETKNMKVI